MLTVGIILFLCGAASTILGIVRNNDIEAKLESIFEKGKSDPGTVFIVIGVLLLVVGAGLIIYYLYLSQQQKTREEIGKLQDRSLSLQADEERLRSGGWKCACGTVNASYISTCACGKSKRDVLAMQATMTDAKKESSLRKQLDELKQLSELGLITKAEYETKRKQLLGI